MSKIIKSLSTNISKYDINLLNKFENLLKTNDEFYEKFIV
jgi:hypothetical protein